MGNPLRDRRTPSEWAASGQVIEFSEKIGKFKQFAEIVKNDLETLDPDKLPGNWRNALVAGRLSFGFADAQNSLPVLRGEVATTIDAVCQRCLRAFELALAADLRLLFGDLESLPADEAGFEVWELEEDRCRPLDIVEEALIMALPLAAMHVDSEACSEPQDSGAEADEKIRPFAALKAQMEQEN